jgi:hypothetical protein
MTEINITKETLKHGRNLIELPFPERTLVVMVNEAIILCTYRKNGAA